jgi:hypothetical protein
MTALREVIDRSDAMPADRGARKLEAGTARMLCATDLWPRSNRAIWRAHAHALAQALGGRLLLLHVLTAAESPRATRRRGARARLILGERLASSPDSVAARSLQSEQARWMTRLRTLRSSGTRI